ncbi:hypothetical protein Q0V21_31105 [Paenibacillus sp. 11B]|uniref:hypothetical protein n=1 Tax=Paenibacillus sp. 11B TaxID=3060965 RepID=UPI0026518E58|nr:hypothetical protein [Paenibacillus sp. 11B]MDN8593180.1 hypothetical protein [Paenibacillus sp. 11B]
MSILKKRSTVTLLLLVFSLLFVHSASAATSKTVYLARDQHAAFSDDLYFSTGDVISFYGESSVTSVHNVVLVLFGPNGGALDSVIIAPNGSGGDTYTVTQSGYYSIGLGTGGAGQTGSVAYGTISKF